MSESTKALNSQVSTLKKNPGRIGHLVKTAKALIVPSKQYATGKTKKLLDAAIKKLKAKRGLNGVIGEGAGPFLDKALQKSAADKKGAGYVAAGSAVGAGVGRAMAREYQKGTIAIRGSDRTIRQIQAGKPSRKIHATAQIFKRRAAKTLKGAGRLGALAGAVTGAVAGVGAKKIAMEKKAVDKKTQDRALAASAVGSGAALGGVLTHDAKKSRIASRVATKGAYKHMGDSSVAGAEKRLARTSKVMTRMGKPLRRAGVKGALIGGLAGAALGAAHLKKEASEFIGRGKIPAGAKDVTPGAQPKAKAKAKAKVPPKATGTQVARVSRSQFLGKGPIPAAKDVSPRTLLKRKAGKVALGVAAGAALAGVAKKHMEKKAANKKEGQSNIPGMAIAGGGLAYARRGAKDAATMSRGLSKQMDHIKKKGGHITQMDVKMAVDTFKKPMARRALKAAGKGVAVGALAGAALDKLNKRGLKKKAAELIHHKGEDIRRGTIGSAAKKMAVGAGLAGAAGGAMVAGPAGALAGGLYGALQGGLLGGGYGMVRSAFRAQDKERSMSPTEFDKLKAKKAK